MTRQSRLWTAWLIGEDGNAPRNRAGYRMARKFWGRQVARMHMPARWKIAVARTAYSRKIGAKP